MRHLHGITTTSGLAADGITLDRATRIPGLRRVAHGVYALPGAPADFWNRAAAALAVAGDDARLTSTAALVARGIPVDPPQTIHVVVPEGKGSRKRRLCDVRRSSHLPESVVMVAGLATVPLPYALSDVGRDLSDRGVAHALSQAAGRRAASVDDVRAVVGERGRFPGSARLRRVLADFGDEETHSRRERLLRRALRRHGLRPADRQLRILAPSGRVLRLADIPFPEVRLDVEVDGPHHDLPAQQAKDRETDRLLRGIDWDVVRVTVYEIDADVDAAARQVVSAYESRARLLGVPLEPAA